MSKIIKYVPFSSETPKGLQDKVIDAMAKGYQPFGSLTVSHGGFEGNNVLFSQAMVKYEEEAK